MRGLVVIVLLAACGDEPPGRAALRIDHAEPDYAPLVGGTLIHVHGAGFDVNSRVLVGGRESVFVHAISTTELEVLVPPGTGPGDSELVAFDDNTATTARGVFHYSSKPTITDVSPARVVASTSNAFITVMGTGFLDEGAGTPQVVLDGVLVPEVTVVDDTTLTFTAPNGVIFSTPDLVLVNQRGQTTHADAFQYMPSESPGLLLFTRFGASFAVFYDPVANTQLLIPALPSASRLRTVFRDEIGDYWGIDVSNRIGRIDLATQTLVDPVFMFDRIPSSVRVGPTLYGIRRTGTNTIGTIDRNVGTFTSLSATALLCCGSFGLAHDGTTLWFTSRASDFVSILLNTFDTQTNTAGTPITLTGQPSGFRIEEMRYYNGELYAIGGSQLFRIDRQTGAVTAITTVITDRYTALEPYEP